MKPENITFLFCICALNAQSAAFSNLDFESATLVPIPNDIYGRVYAEPALPGWTGYVGTNQASAVLHDNSFVSSSGISILDSSNTVYPGPAIQGNWSVLLEAGTELGRPVPADVSLVQTGTVPGGARSLRFAAEGTLGAPFAVSLGGANLSLISLSAPGDFTQIYAADISAFAGTTVPLQFTVFSPGLAQFPAHLMLDSIELSSTPVPEPSTWAIFGVAGLLGWAFVRRKARRR